MKFCCKALYLILSLFLITSCDNEPIDFSLREDLPELATDTLVGSWDLVGAELVNATASYAVAQDSIIKEVSGESTSYDMTLSFYEDKSTSFTGSYLQTFNLDLGLNDSSETISINAEDIFNSGSWSRTSNTLELSNNEQTQDISIVSLTNRSLQLQFNKKQEQSIQNLDVNLDAGYVLSFKKTQ